MAFPHTALPVKVHIYPGADPGSDIGTWPAAVDISDKVRHDQGITLADGRADEAGQVDPGQIALTLDNTTGDFVPRNPLGAYYPLLRRNCPIRVGTVCGEDAFTRTSGSGWGTADLGGAWTVTGSASDWTVTGGKGVRSLATANLAAVATLDDGDAFNVEGALTGSVPVVAAGAALVVAALIRYVDASNYYLVYLDFGTTGTVQLKIGRIVDGGFTVGDSVALAGSYTAGQEYRLAWAAVGSTLMGKAWPVSGSDPGAWQVSYSDPDPLIGHVNGVYLWRVAGNTNPGAVAFSVDDYTLEAVEAVGTVMEWPVRWDLSGRNATAPIKASGVLRRLAQGKTPLRSPLYRQLSAQAITGYWPLEDQSGTADAGGVLLAGSAVSWNRPAIATDVTFGAASDLPGAAPVAFLGQSSSRVRATVSRRVPSGEVGFAFLFFARLATNAGAGNFSGIASIHTTGRVFAWQISVSGTEIRIEGFEEDAVLLVNSTFAHGINVTRWFAVQLETSTVAGTLEWTLLWHQVGATVAIGTGSTFASSSISSIIGCYFEPGQFSNGLYLGHVYAGGESLPFVDETFFSVANGYVGELASDRILRLCREEGIPCYAEPGDSQPLGPQRADAIVPLLRSAEQADMGVLYESGNGLAYRPRSARYQRPVLLALDQSSGHLADPPEPTDDDQRLRNDVTVGRDGGAQGVRHVDEDSVAVDGRYDEGLTVNLSSDAPLQDYAAFRVYLGTRPELRWPRIVLNFARNPGLLPAWRSRPGWGPRLTVDNVLAQVRGDGPDVIVEGITQTLTSFGWSAELSCSPARPWDLPVLDDAVAPPRADTAGTTTTSAVTSSATSIPYTVAAGAKAWVTTAANPAEFPLDITVGGEQMTVTAATGTHFTVDRAVNGVVKAHDAGTPIALYDPTIVAL